MLTAQNVKYLNLVPPAAKVDNAAFTVASIDAQGWDYCQIVCILGDTDIAMAALKVGEADTDSGHVDIDELVFGTAKDIAGDDSSLPAADDDNGIFVFDIDLKKRKRFLKLAASAGDGATGTFMTAIAILSRGESVPVTAAERGAKQILRA